MESLSLLLTNLLSPPIIAFAAGLIAVWVRSDLKFPDALYQGLTIYLLLAIGFKGGLAVAGTSITVFLFPFLATLFVGSLIPIGVFFTLRYGMKMNVPNAAALAAHYGSVSAVTFMATLAFLDRLDQPYETFMPAIMALMEIPSIFVALILARKFKEGKSPPLMESVHEVLSGKSFVLLICGLVAGFFAGAEGEALISPFLIAPFYGVLMIFLLEMGLIAGKRLKTIGSAGPQLVGFALIAPILQGLLGLFVAQFVGFSQGGATIFAMLSASASYIAAPAAVRVALPEANPGYYVTCSLGITFPFNLVFGIPLFHFFAGLLYG